MDIFGNIIKAINTIPVIYGQDGLGEHAIVYLHYFCGGSDWWITERDNVVGEPQLQAYGYASINGSPPEAGYISIQEIIENGVELDFHFTPRTFISCEK